MVVSTGRPTCRTVRRLGLDRSNTTRLRPLPSGRKLSPAARGYGIGRISFLIAWVARELRVYRLMSKDPRTPTQSKILLWAAVGYAFWPLGLLPDFIPVIGYLDDAIIVPTLIFIAVRGVPAEVARECRQRAAS